MFRLRAQASTDALCYEERVLYRMLSGMHASINTHIAMYVRPRDNVLISSSASTLLRYHLMT